MMFPEHVASFKLLPWEHHLGRGDP